MKKRENASKIANQFSFGLKRPVLIGVGALSLTAGIVGIFVPLWPTTCFLLVSAACFSKSSDRFYRWMMTNRWFGRHLRSYREHGTVDRKVCWGSLMFLWPSLTVSLLLTSPPLWVWLLAASVGIGVTAHLRSLGKAGASRCDPGRIQRFREATPNRS